MTTVRRGIFLPTLLRIACLSAVPLQATEIVAHRGASYDAPENTVAAARLGWAQGADAVELDIHLTHDGKIAVLHDADLRRTTGRAAAVADLTFAEIAGLDAGSWKSPAYAGEKIPSLDDIIRTVPAGRHLLVEIKSGPEILPALIATLTRTGASPAQVVLIGFDFEVLAAVRRELPDYRTLWIVHYKPDADTGAVPLSFDELVRRSRAAGFSGMSLNHRWPLDAADIRRAHDAGLEVHVWTVDDVETARHWDGLGIEGITTNRPGWLREQLAP